MKGIYKTTKGNVLPSPRTKANTSRFHQKANTQALNREEFAFYPSHIVTLVQLETKRKPPLKKLKPPPHHQP